MCRECSNGNMHVQISILRLDVRSVATGSSMIMV